MNPNPFMDRLSLWGVDHPAVDGAMLLDFIEKMAGRQPVPVLAQSSEELQERRLPLIARIRHSLGLDPWPERTPLNASITGKLERAGYTIEKLIFEAWPGLPVSAHLYLPHTFEQPYPGLIYACGHWMEAGKLAVPIQSFCASAARLGIMTLVYDPIGQGERLENWCEHGNLSILLTGQCQLGLMVWESIRALDYLQSRPEINPDRIGMTGASGGGLNTFFTTAIEDRFACAIPAAYPSTFLAAMRAERDLNWEDGIDMCNQVPQVMGYAGMADIAALSIPRPYMILAGRGDKIFPVEGARQTAGVIKHYYELAGVPERFCYAEFAEEHGFQQSLREAAYGWLLRWLRDEGDGSPVKEEALELFPDPYPVGYMTPPNPTPADPRGQSPTSIPVQEAQAAFCFGPHKAFDSQAVILENAKARTDAAQDKLPFPTIRAELSRWQEGLRDGMRDILGKFPGRIPLETRIFNQVWENGITAERVTFQSEEGITIPGMLMLPEIWDRPVPFVVHVGEWGKNQGLQTGLIEELLQAGYGILAIDVRGVGETAASDFEAATNLLMMDRPLFGQRVWDVIRAVDFVWERCYIGPQIDKGRMAIVGQGVGGLWGLFAAALDERVAAFAGLETLFSFRDLIKPQPHYPASVYLFDVLKHFDVGQVIGAFAPRPVYFRPLDAYRQPCSRAAMMEAFFQAKKVFSTLKAPANYFLVDTSRRRKEISKWLNVVLEPTTKTYQEMQYGLESHP